MSEEITVNEMNIFFTVPETCIELEVKAIMLDENNNPISVTKKLTLNDIVSARKDFLDYVDDGDDYDAKYVLTDEGRSYVETLMKGKNYE